MKYDQIIIEFRKDYLKLYYVNAKIKVYDLRAWTAAWCKTHNIPHDLTDCFFNYVYSYAEKNYYEKLIPRLLKKQEPSNKE